MPLVEGKMFSVNVVADYLYGIILGLVLALSLFLLAISARAHRKSGLRIVRFLSASFVVILVMDLIFIADYFSIVTVPFSSTVVLVLVLILLLFYYGIVRGLS